MPEAPASLRSTTAGSEPTPTRNGRRPGEHGDAIVAAAHRLIRDKGDFTTQELIKEADVALKTFYRYFASKDLLLVAVIGDLVEANAAAMALQAQTLPDPVARLEFLVTSPMRLMGDHSETFNPRFITSEHWRLHRLYPEELAAATRPFVDVIRRTLEAGIDAGIMAPRSPERDAWLIATSVMAVFHHYAFHPDDPTLATAADDLRAFCLAAVHARPPAT